MGGIWEILTLPAARSLPPAPCRTPQASVARQNQGSIYRDATKNRYVGRGALLAEVDPGNVCAGGAEGHVGCKTFDQMAGELKA